MISFLMLFIKCVLEKIVILEENENFEWFCCNLLNMVSNGFSLEGFKESLNIYIRSFLLDIKRLY